MKIEGSKYTWVKGGGSKLSKFDRFLLNDYFVELWPNSEVITDTRIYSDHKPLILRQVTRNYGSIPFKLYNSWLDEDELGDIVRSTWLET